MTEAWVTADGRMRLGQAVFLAQLGAGGVRADKQEGDGATPSGVLALRRVLYRADRGPIPRCAVAVEPIAPDDCWCDDPSHPDYNRKVTSPHPARHERLWRPDGLYDVVGVLGWNDAPTIAGRGSAIFLHATAPVPAPTAGCIALPVAELRVLLAAGVTAVRVEP